MEKRGDRLRDVLEEEILTGVLRPGDRLEELQLAERFGVSRTPIREALFQLSAAGLIEQRPRRGTFVAEVGPKRLMEMFDVMSELEAMCARLAARRATPEDLAALRRAHDGCAAAAERGDFDGYYYENEIFHEKIREASRNGFLVEQADALQKRLKAYRRLQLRARDRLRASFEEHDAVIAAIEAGDAEAAGEAMRGHVTVQGERFADLLASLERREAKSA
ncbi:GntR family transcriptional regulator [Pelagibius litoralis]|uniref:GntR family transcriptional regulator n=1 Tax=Pelagibius litoralis TaxID=374515 RepID=A0A967CCI7_9PROT|nr:GntR family transcriptional regulator [Pelagibius litoralis]NIA69103.1 GntR family transcriptional regulator [Pelagibius litoralis]